MTGAELACLALAVYFEARNQDFLGQIAVAQVVMERVEDPRYPDTMCGVVFDHKQFSFYWDGKSDTPYEEEAWLKARALARAVANGTLYIEELDGVTHYHAKYVNPYWADHMELVVDIDDHVFYKSEEDT